MFRRCVLPVLALSLVVGAACSPKDAPGIVMLAVSTNLVPGRDFTRGDLIAGDLSDAETNYSQTEFYAQEVDFPFTLSLRGAEPDAEKKYPARVRIVFSKGPQGAEVVVAARDVQVVLPGPEQQQMVHVSVDWLSMYDDRFVPLAGVVSSIDLQPFPPAGRNCSETTTLNALGQCVAIGADEGGEFDRKVEPYDPTRIYGGGISASEGSACFSAQACLEGGQVVTATLVSGKCQVDLPTEVTDKTTLAVLTASSVEKDVARCGAEGCGDDLGAAHGRGVVLDREVYTFSGARVTLPVKVCERFPAGARILVSDACVKKERSLPLCPAAGVESGRVGATRVIAP